MLLFFNDLETIEGTEDGGARLRFEQRGKGDGDIGAVHSGDERHRVASPEGSHLPHDHRTNTQLHRVSSKQIFGLFCRNPSLPPSLPSSPPSPARKENSNMLFWQ